MILSKKRSQSRRKSSNKESIEKVKYALNKKTYVEQFLNDSDMSIERFRLIIMYFTSNPSLFFSFDKRFNHDPENPSESKEVSKREIYQKWIAPNFNKYKKMIFHVLFFSGVEHFGDVSLSGTISNKLLSADKQLENLSGNIKNNYLNSLSSLSSDSIKLILLVCIFIILKSVNKIYTKNIPFLTRNPKLKSLMEGKLPTIDPIFNRQRKAYKKYDHHCLLDIDSNLHEIFLKAEKNNWSIEQLRTVLIQYTPNVGFGLIPSLFGRNIQGKHLIRETGEVRDSPGEIAKAIVYYSAMTDKVNLTSIYNKVTGKTAKKRSSSRSQTRSRPRTGTRSSSRKNK